MFFHLLFGCRTPDTSQMPHQNLLQFLKADLKLMNSEKHTGRKENIYRVIHQTICQTTATTAW